MKRVACLLVTLLAGCDLYWSHNSGDDVCNGDISGGAPAFEARDPYSGECYYQDGGGGCGPCGVCEDGGATPVANGAIEVAAAYCSGACEGLDESACLATSDCHAEYGEYAAGDGTMDAAGNSFVSCWDITPLTPLEGGDCTLLDAFTCSEHDDCISVMYLNGGTPEFEACAPEGSNTDCSNIDCGSGSTCEVQCVPCDGSDGACMDGCGAVCVPNVTCDELDCGSGATCGVTCDEWGNCAPSCIPNTPPDPGSCTGGVMCDLAPPACPANTTPGIEGGCWTGFCIPNDQCGPSDPGSCDQSTVTCNPSQAPACPAGTVPGVSGACYSGYCIPESACPVAACETLTDEASCVAREPGCTPVYSGEGCTCTSDGICNCPVETFARCQTSEWNGSGGGTGGGSGGGSAYPGGYL